MPKRYIPTTSRDEAEDIIRKLKEELYLARRTIVDLMPEK
jgi:hypothetical protein